MALEGLSVAGGVEVWGEISRQKRPPEELQELMLSLSYLPSAERLTVVVLKARNLLTPGHESKDTLGRLKLHDLFVYFDIFIEITYHKCNVCCRSICKSILSCVGQTSEKEENG